MQFNKRRFQEKSGQGLVEYLLFSALLVGIIIGFFYPIVKTRFAVIQETIVATGIEVVSQQRLGIPYCWFFCQSGSSFADVDGRFASLDRGGAGGLQNQGNVDQGDDDEEGGDEDGGGLNLGRGSGGAGSFPSSGDASSTDGFNSGLDEEGGARRRGSRGGQAGGFDSDSTETGDFERSRGRSSEDQGPSGAEAEKPSEEGVVSRGKGIDGSDEREREGGCRNINPFTLLKILALIGLVILVGAIILGNRGNNGKNN